MAATYTEITLQEMHELLEPLGFREVQMTDNTVEVVYGKRVAKDLTLRVYTSIAHGTSRDCGEDAVRVCLVRRCDNGIIIGVGKSSRTNRTQNWRKNLTSRIAEWTSLLGPKCPICSSYTKLRDGKYGKFWSCSDYPTCSGKMKYDK